MKRNGLIPKRVRRSDGFWTTVYVRPDNRSDAPPPPDNRADPITTSNNNDDPTINLTDPTPQIVKVLNQLGELAERTNIDSWSLVGGLMTEIVLQERGAVNLRSTVDGDIVGDLSTIPSALTDLQHVLTADMRCTLQPTGFNREFNTRYVAENGATIDLLAPPRSSKQARDFLQAPGTDIALKTSRRVTVTWATGSATLRVPTLAGALYAKVTGWKEIIGPNRIKHLEDALQMLVVATPADLTFPDANRNAYKKRWRWLKQAIQQHPEAWGRIPVENRRLALSKLNEAIEST